MAASQPESVEKPETAAASSPLDAASQRAGHVKNTLNKKYQEGESILKEPVDDVASSRSGGYRRDKGQRLEKLMRSAGFHDAFLEGFRDTDRWKGLEEKPLAHALADMAAWFREEGRQCPRVPVGRRVAFIGTPGVGKTTALGKWLARKVFGGDVPVQVLKLDDDLPNADDNLKVSCEALGAELLRYPLDVDLLREDAILLIDTPGISPLDRKGQAKLAATLREIEVDSVVLVMNAIYEISSLQASYEMGIQMGATHAVYTHMDEPIGCGKLWNLVTAGKLSPLFVSYGQAVGGEFSEGVIEYLTDKTFPYPVLQ